jgi:ATP-binding cassette subfamily F protein 3
VTLAVHERTKLGVVGPNGSGKTTLLRLLAGDLKPDSGEVVLRQGLVLGRLAQDDRELLALDPTVADALYRSQAELQLEALAGELADAAHDPPRLRELERAYDDALTALSAAHEPDRALIADLLGELGLRSIPESRRMSELSGGQRRLVLLARVLASDPDLLVLDEPEAHLDLRARGLVADRLGSRRGATVLVSHDRALLDVAIKQTLDLSDGRCDLYAGGYTFYLEERPKLMARLEGEYERARAEVKRQEQVFFQYREWARLNSKFASRARARLTLLERARSRVDKPQKRRDRTLSLSFSSDARGRVMAEATQAEVRYSDEVRVGPVDLVLERGDRVALIGPNGAGKSTLLRLLAGEQEPTAGRVRIKEGARVALMTQESLSVDLERTPLDVVLDERAMGRDDAVRRICALGLDYEHCLAPLGRLSGGQRVRVHLLRVSLQRPDLLLLDEPTNYIDTHSAEVVQTELEAFSGCVIAATHDRYFLETFATRIVELTPAARGTRVAEREGLTAAAG